MPDSLAVFPLQGEGRLRLIGTVEDDSSDRQFQWEDVSQDILRRLRIDVKAINLQKYRPAPRPLPAGIPDTDPLSP
ncbi:MAG TPA: hypothetical protein VL978_17650 [Puia sp.]|nr:hypothetical protein [Puia sp.]